MSDDDRTPPLHQRTVNVGGVPVVIGLWFVSAAEANEWLSFDASGEDMEVAAYAEPDHFAEWERWRRDG